MAVLWQVVIVVAVMAILAGIAGPSIGGLLGRATGAALTASVSSAAAALREVYEEGIAADEVNADGSPKPGLLARIGAADSAEGLDWRAVWAFDGEDDSNIVRVQFIAAGPKGTVSNIINKSALTPTGPPGAVAPPEVSWLAASWLAARVHARAETGEWACALVIHAADTQAISKLGEERKARYPTARNAGPRLQVARGRPTSDPVGPGVVTWQEAHDRLKRSNGTWYDSGDEAAADGLFDCSPVQMAGGNHPTSRNGRARLPAAEGAWEIRQSIASIYSTPADGVDVAGTLTVAP